MPQHHPREDAPPRASRVHRWLPWAALVLVTLAAVMGWGASFVGLHAYAMTDMTGFTYWTAWLVPATFDGAAFACTLMTYRSSINGRSAVRGRVLMWGFTGVSAWINWIHQHQLEAQIVAAGLPVAAVAVFDIVLLEMRADYEAQHGKKSFRLRPGLLLLRWIVDRTGTKAAFRDQIVGIPVAELAGLGRTDTTSALHDQQRHVPQPATAPRETPPKPTPTPTVRAAGSRAKLPPPMVAELERVTAQAAEEGRAITTADVQCVIKVNDATAQRIVADMTGNAGQIAA